MSSKFVLRPQVAGRLFSQLTSIRKLSSLPIAVKVSSEEVAANSLTWQNLELATRALHRDGLVVLEDVIEHAKIDRLNIKMTEDARILQSRGDASPFNYNKGNIQQDPPTTKQHFEPSILLNPLATQPVHSDADFEHPNCPFALVVNVPLVEMTPENGSTEVWLGTHHLASLAAQEGTHGERASGRIKMDLLEKRACERPPAQPVVKKGSLVIRDLRLWHAGKPNFSEAPRVMLAMIHFAPWFRNAMRVEYSEDLKPTLEEAKDQLQVQSTFFSETEIMDRYLMRGFGNAYNFDQENNVNAGI